MKIRALLTALFFVLAIVVQTAMAQMAPDKPPARTDVYHVHFAHAALGKAAALGEFLKTPNPNSPMPTHFLLLRHENGDSWDYVVIQHLGPKVTIEATGTPVPAAMRDLSDWHGDTYVNGPAWPEFAKAMGIAEGSAGKTADYVYIVSVYRPAPGHRDALEKALGAPPSSGDPIAGAVLMQHLDGAPWTFLTVTRYNSYADFGTGQSKSVADTAKNQGAWYQLRDHVSFHTDTLTARVAP